MGIPQMNHQKVISFFCDPYSLELHRLIENSIEKNLFNQASSWGFKYHKKRNGYIHADYIEKQLIKERIVDPFGVETEYERTVYNKIEFILRIDTPNILIFAPPRTHRRAINQLAQFTDYSIAILNKQADLYKWVDAISEIGYQGELVKINIDPIKFSENTLGKITLTGDKELKSTCQKLIDDASFSLKNVRVRFNHKTGLPDVDLFSNGKVCFNKSVDMSVINEFYQVFCKCIT